jgi:hypothetical protein
MCKPFVKATRRDLDRCGDIHKDPYSATTASNTTASSDAINESLSHFTTSDFTWASRNEMARKGKGNLFTDQELQPQLPVLMKKITELRNSSAQLCCGADESCRQDFERVEVTVCKPNPDPNAPDPCVFGGSYKMPGSGYSSIFRAIQKQYGTSEAVEFKRLAEKNLRAIASAPNAPSGVTSGSIVLSSYVSKTNGIASLEPTILHEFGHACSMIKMQHAALGGKSIDAAKPLGDTAKLTEINAKALRATHWLDRARQRCSTDLELPEAYFDFWESMGESRGLAQCLFQLTTANQKQLVDRPCPGLCPGHYMEESVGVAFSLLLGDLSGTSSSAFPNTCDHVRDGQHPMVSDVVECLTQHSPRFRERLRRTYSCE